ncbi:MAG TPA: NAD-dependent epimerase/dehydratase family protein [Acetobacteraceae bacterium]|nr:NAD-dependent epimerase/dehydratase family protein [Acetobacteraceae bacterium]
MRYLITGGAGFIGSTLCDALLARGDSVRVLDDLSTGSRANLPPDVPLIQADVADPDAVHAAVDGVDGVFHLAAIASVTRGLTDWLGTHRANLTGTITVFDAIRRHARPIPVVYASSAAVYGDCPIVPISETTACRPLSAYGADKYACELHAHVAGHAHGIPATGLRFFNVYGPRQDPHSPYSGVISIFCTHAARGSPIDVFGDGRQTRDFIFVADVVAALLAAMQRPATDSPVFNICTGTAISVLDLARTVTDLAGTTAEIRHRPPRPGDIRHSVGVPDLARTTLGLGPPVPLRDGLRKVLDWLTAAR